MELYCKGNFSRFFWNNYQLEKYISHIPHCKLPLLETVTRENYSFDRFCAMYEETILNNLVLFARNVGEVEETDLMFKD